MRPNRPILATAALLAALCAPGAVAEPVTSAITVQGVLAVNGAPGDGVYDLRFTPYGEPAASTPLAPPQDVDNILVLAGAFTAKVDFGRALFQGDRLYLEIAVREGNASGAFETLQPRQELTAAPFALKPAAASVTDLELAADAVQTQHILDGAVGAADIGSGAVGTSELADGAVVAAKLANGAVVSTKIADNAVVSTKLADGAVVAAKLADAVVVSAKLADGAVVTAKLADSAVASAKLVDGAVVTAKLTDGAVTGPKLANSAVSSAAIADGAIGLADLAANAVDGSKVVDGGIGAVDLAPGVIPPAGWGLSGNSVADGQFLGTTNGTPMALRSDVGVTINGDRFNNNTELTIRGSAATADANADFALWPRGGTAFFNLAAIGSTFADTRLSVSAINTNPFSGYLSRLVLYPDGSLAVGGAMPTTTPSTSFVFADAGGAFNPSAPNQFLVRAGGGVAINRTPSSITTELTIGPTPGGTSVDVVLGASGSTAMRAALTLGTPGTDSNFRVESGESPGGSAFFTVLNRNSASTETPALQIVTSGASFARFLSLFRGRADGTSLLPAHTIHVGDSTIPNSGNGAHLTAGGVWTNGSSRTFKHAIEAIEPERVLDALLALPVNRWRYRGSDDTLHLGPMAEDFHAAFGLGGDARYIGTVDADGVALAAIQGLNARLQRENESLRDALDGLARRLQALERSVSHD